MNFPRASGILLHPTSLPGKYGIGDFGGEARRFVDFLSDAKQTYWQILPLGPTGYGDSPYQCFSAFAGNTNLISPQKIVEDGFLTEREIKPKKKFPAGRVDYGAVVEYKNGLLKKAFERFRQTDDRAIADAFHRFCDENWFWLEDYALFRALKLERNHVSWQEFEEPLKLRRPEALAEARETLDEEIFAQKYYQFTFFKQWRELKNYANGKNIKIVGDVPIFVALDSSDVWCNPTQFKLNEDGSAKVVAGVPPDYFSKTGQLWGNPIYDWENMRADGFEWWKARVAAMLQTVDIVRVDHFRGFAAAWEVPGGDATAVNGKWVDVPGEELFYALKNAFGELPFWAEDLGVITDDVKKLRDEFNFPGMKILQYAFGGDASNHDLPHNYIKNCVAYTGTHDNETTVGWFEVRMENESQMRRDRDFCLKYLNTDGEEIHWDFIRAIWASVADTAIAPMQDVLGLGNEARMNLPASKSGNWYWRCKDVDFSVELARKLSELSEIYGR
jgi:4-alpha-glucanotransferase